MDAKFKSKKAILTLLAALAITTLALLYFQRPNDTPYKSSDISEDEAPLLVVHINELKGRKDDISDMQVNSIQSELYNIAVKNIENPDGYYKGEIRKGTYEKEELGSQQYKITFIADIPNLRQSWGVIIDSSDIDQEVLVYCLDNKDLIYEQFECTEYYD